MVKAAEVAAIAQEEGGASPIKAVEETDDPTRIRKEDLEVNAKTKTTNMSYLNIKSKTRRCNSPI